MPLSRGVRGEDSRVSSTTVAGSASVAAGQFSSGGWSVNLGYSGTSPLTFTATVSQPLDGTGQWVEIFELTQGGSTQYLKWCNTGTTCTTGATAPHAKVGQYVAVVGSVLANTYAEYGASQKVAESQTISPPPWSISFQASVTSSVTFTATTNYVPSLIGAYIEVFEKERASNPTYLTYSQNQTVTSTSVPHAARASFVAVVGSTIANRFEDYPQASEYALSGDITPPGWAVSLQGGGSSPVATTNYAVGVDSIYTEIFDLSQTGGVTDIGWCYSGTVCSKSGGTGPYLATVGGLSNTPYPSPLYAATDQPSTSSGSLLGLFNPLGARAPCTCGDPVDNATGNFSTSSTDLHMGFSGAQWGGSTGLSVQGTSALSLVRTYNSLDTTSDGPFGFGWRDGNGWSVAPDTASGATVVVAGNGARTEFWNNGSGGYTAAPSVLATLAPGSGGGYRLTLPHHRLLVFNAAGAMTSITGPGGVPVSLTYDASGHLAQVSDLFGRQLVYNYSNGHVASVTATGGRVVRYGYTNGDLTSVTDPTGAVTAMTYSSSHQLRTLTDAEGGVVTNTYDAAGRVSSQTDAAGQATTWSYTTGSDGATTTTVTDPRGTQRVLNFVSNILTSQTAAAGTPSSATTRYQDFDGSLQPRTIIDPNGGKTQLTYDALGDVLSVTDAKQQRTDFSYNAQGDRLTSKQPGALNPTSWTYNPDGLVTSQTDPVGRTSTWTYTPQGLLDTATNPRGKVTHLTYDTGGDPISSTSPDGDVTTSGYNASGWVTSITTPRGNKTGAAAENYTTHFGYDAAGRLTSTTDPADTVTADSFNKVGDLARRTVTDKGGTVLADDTFGHQQPHLLVTASEAGRTAATNTYGAGNVLTSTVDADGATTTYSYDPLGRVKSVTTPRGNAAGATATDYTWTFAYDANGNRTTVTDPQGRVTATGYDALNRPISQTTPLGLTSLTSYDALGRVTSTTDPRGTVTGATASDYTTNYGYDDAGQLTSVQRPGQAATTLGYDADGNLTSQTSPSGTSKTTWTYNGENQPLTQVEPNGNAPGGTAGNYTTSWGYDADGNPNTETDQLGRTTSYAYDALGRPTSRTDAINHTTNWAYDGLGRLTTATPPATGTGAYAVGTTYTFDQYGDLRTRTDALNRTTNYTFTSRHQLAQVVDSVGDKRTFAYDPEGNLTSWVAARGYARNNIPAWTVAQSYDARGLLTARNTADPTFGATYSYDNDGRLTQMVDGAGTSAMTYFADGNLKTLTHPQGTYAYTYNRAEQVTSRSYPTGGSVDYSYDPDGLMSSVTADTKTTTLGYDANQQLTGITYPSTSHVAETRSYTRTGATASITTAFNGSVLSKHTYTRDAVGNPTQITRTRGTTTSNEAYTYDARDQLTKYCLATSCTSPTKYATSTYDAVGNRTQQARVGLPSPGTTTYAYDNADNLISSTISGTTTIYDHNADGDFSSGGRTWNVLDQLTSQSSPGTTSYTYDGQGNRRTVTDTTGTKKLSWDINNPMPMLAAVTTTAASNPTFAQRYGPDGLLLESYQPGASADRSYYGHDDLGSITDIVQGGAAAWNFTYEPTGLTAGSNKLLPTAANPNFGWTSAYYDTSEAAYHLRARDYNPTLGRFYTPDPAGTTTSSPYQSTYTYANNNPLTYTDPTGLCPNCLAGAVIGGLANATIYALTHHDTFTWTGFACAAVTGAVGGLVFGATLGLGSAIGLEAGAGSFIAGGALGNIAATTSQSILSGGGTLGLSETAQAGLTGAAGAGIGYAGGQAIGYGLNALAPYLTKLPTGLVSTTDENVLIRFGAANGARSAVQGSRVVSGRFPRNAGPDDILVRRGADGGVTHYQTYGADGLPLKRVDVTGRAHGGVDTPHVVAFERHVNPATGDVFVRPGSTVRPATPEELMGLD